jgi:hypothetical protein
MNNAQSALKMAAGFFLAIALITIAVVMFINAQDATKSAQSNFSSIQEELDQTQFTVYDNTTVSGSQVVNAIRKFSDKSQFGIQVITGKQPAGTWYYNTVNIGVQPGATGYGDMLTAGTGTIGNAQNEALPDYINPSGRFQAKLIKDNNNAIRGIVFKQ